MAEARQGAPPVHAPPAPVPAEEPCGVPTSAQRTVATDSVLPPAAFAWLAIVLAGMVAFAVRGPTEARATALGVAIGLAVVNLGEQAPARVVANIGRIAAPVNPVLTLLFAYFVAGAHGVLTEPTGVDVTASGVATSAIGCGCAIASTSGSRRGA